MYMCVCACNCICHRHCNSMDASGSFIQLIPFHSIKDQHGISVLTRFNNTSAFPVSATMLRESLRCGRFESVKNQLAYIHATMVNRHNRSSSNNAAVSMSRSAFGRNRRDDGDSGDPGGIGSDEKDASCIPMEYLLPPAHDDVVCMYDCTYIYIYTYARTLSMYIRILSIYIYICVCVYAHVCTSVCVCVCVCVCVHESVMFVFFISIVT